MLYTAGRAVISGRRFVNERMNGGDEEEFEEDEGFHEDDEVEERSAAS